MEKTTINIKTGLLLSGLLLLAVVAALLLLDFRLMQGQFTTEQQVMTFSSSIDEGQGLPLEQNLNLYVIAPEPIAGRLERELSGRLGASAHIGQVHLQQPPLEMADGSLLLVEVIDPDLFWTPVFSRANPEIRVSYASDGKVDWIDAESVHFEGGEPARRIQGDYQARDRAFGILSLPGYYSYLSEQIAGLVDNSLQQSLSAP